FLAAQLGVRECTPAIQNMAEAYLAAELQESETITNSSRSLLPSRLSTRWTATLGEAYRPMLLSHAVDEGMSVSGVAVLFAPAGRHFLFPRRLAAELSRRAQDAGDITGALVAD